MLERIVGCHLGGLACARSIQFNMFLMIHVEEKRSASRRRANRFKKRLPDQGGGWTPFGVLARGPRLYSPLPQSFLGQSAPQTQTPMGRIIPSENGMVSSRLKSHPKCSSLFITG